MMDIMRNRGKGRTPVPPIFLFSAVRFYDLTETLIINVALVEKHCSGEVSIFKHLKSFSHSFGRVSPLWNKV